MPEPLDPSQRAAEPLQPVAPSVALKRLSLAEMEGTEPDPNESDEAVSNRQRAAAEISMIFELKDSVAFQWFEREFIDAAYSRAFEALRSPHVKPEELPKLQTTYLALREVKAGMIEREIAHRELIDPHDEQVTELREKLARL